MKNVEQEDLARAYAITSGNLTLSVDITNCCHILDCEKFMNDYFSQYQSLDMKFGIGVIEVTEAECVVFMNAVEQFNASSSESCQLIVKRY